MNDEHRTEQILREDAELVFARSDEGPHLSDERLASVVCDGAKLTKAELTHLAECAECREVLAIELREREGGRRASRWVERTLLGVAVAAVAAGLALFIIPTPAPMPRTRGGDLAPLTADVTVLAVDDSGRRRELSDSDRVRLTERLGFRYGNPQGRFSTVTILGWDGERLHWYYPASDSEPAQQVEGGKRAMSVRLPFDVKLNDHRPGPLSIVVAFDRNPKALADALRRGAPLDSLGATRLNVVVTSSAAKRR